MHSHVVGLRAGHESTCWADVCVFNAAHVIVRCGIRGRGVSRRTCADTLLPISSTSDGSSKARATAARLRQRYSISARPVANNALPCRWPFCTAGSGSYAPPACSCPNRRTSRSHVAAGAHMGFAAAVGQRSRASSDVSEHLDAPRRAAMKSLLGLVHVG